jgi:UDP-N-acetyl-D-galactosamine dehydrogenase
VYHWLKTYGLNPIAVDPIADKSDFSREFGVDLLNTNDVKDADCLVFLVAHEEFCKLTADDIDKMYEPSIQGQKRVLIDVKSIFSSAIMREKGYTYWSL